MAQAVEKGCKWLRQKRRVVSGSGSREGLYVAQTVEKGCMWRRQ